MKIEIENFQILSKEVSTFKTCMKMKPLLRVIFFVVLSRVCLKRLPNIIINIQLKHSLIQLIYNVIWAYLFSCFNEEKREYTYEKCHLNERNSNSNSSIEVEVARVNGLIHSFNALKHDFSLKKIIWDEKKNITKKMREIIHEGTNYFHFREMNTRIIIGSTKEFHSFSSVFHVDVVVVSKWMLNDAAYKKETKQWLIERKEKT